MGLKIKQMYLSQQKDSYKVPQMRSKDDMGCLSRENELIEEARNAKEYFDKLKVRRPGQETTVFLIELPEFKKGRKFYSGSFSISSLRII